MSYNRNKVPPMTPKTLFFYIVSIILVGLYFFFIKGGFSGKLCACICCPLTVAYTIYAYRKEKKADKNAELKNKKITDGSLFESLDWKSQYSIYQYEHPFEKPKYPNMAEDLLMKFHRREYVVGMGCMFFLMLCSFCGFLIQKYIMAVVGILLFGFLFYLDFAKYTGKTVRNWLKGDIDYIALEDSYLKSRMLTYKKNGFAFGTTHIHAFTEKKIYAVDYRLVKGISRKIVRLKKYEDSLYSSEEYRHFTVIHVRLPKSGKIQNVEIELNEFQVQMVIDKMSEYKRGEALQNDLILGQETENSLDYFKVKRKF